MKKRLIWAVLVICSMGLCTIHAKAEENFKTVYVPYEQEYDWRTTIKARFADTKEPIPLSDVYDGRLYASVPLSKADKEIEAYAAESVEFSDKDNSVFEFYPFERLSMTGVVVGNEIGQALPFNDITRAEAAAMLMRLFGIDADSSISLPFEDVPESEWYYGVVAAAYNSGIITGDSETTFSPYRNVTREEFVCMAARAVKFAGLGYPGSQYMNAMDFDKVSDWAVSAYELMGDYAPSGYDDTDPEKPARVLAPQQNATRYDVADMLNTIANMCPVYPSKTAEEYGFDKEMPVIDGSTSTYPFTSSVYNLFHNGSNHPSKPEKHSKSHQSYERLINGEIDMMFASVYPANDILKLAQEKGVELELIPIAYDAMVFFTNKENSINGITKEQISNIYVNNAYLGWDEIGGPDAFLYPYCRNNDSGSHAQMERHFLNGNEIHSKIREETTSIAMASVLTDVIDAKTTEPTGYALGYSIYYYYHNADAVLDTKRHLKLLAVDGVYPTDETIADGSYPLSDHTYIVIRKDTTENSPARKMAEFMLTDLGQTFVQNSGFGKLKTTIDDLYFEDKLNTQMPEDENYMFSPISVKMALALAANGADGETEAEILNAIGVHDISGINAISKELIDKFSRVENLKLDIANSVWINTNQNFSMDFKELAEEYYSAESGTVNKQNAVSKINSWVSNKTNGKIDSIVKDPDFDAMLINAIYFKGVWENEFNEDTTKQGDFYNLDGSISKPYFMNRTGWINYASEGNMQVIELPYKNRFDSFSESGEYIDSQIFDDVDVSMYLIMGDTGKNLGKTLGELAYLNRFERKYINLSVPKFKIEYETSLNDALKVMGINKAFEGDAEFEKMFDQGNMFLSDAIHKTFINVDEHGTEAAAVTALAMAGSSLPPEPVELKFDKPFCFAIRDNISGEILFMGRFVSAK